MFEHVGHSWNDTLSDWQHPIKLDLFVFFFARAQTSIYFESEFPSQKRVRNQKLRKKNYDNATNPNGLGDRIICSTKKKKITI